MTCLCNKCKIFALIRAFCIYTAYKIPCIAHSPGTRYIHSQYMEHFNNKML